MLSINFLDSEFSNIKTTLCEASKDEANKVEMTHSQMEVIWFDKVAQQYSEKIKTKKGITLSSVGAIFFKDRRMVLVEFKNGVLDPSTEFRCKIQKKLYESLLILMNLKKGLTLQYFQKNAIFGAVYNASKNSKEEICHTVRHKGGLPSIQKLNLSYMKGYCCQEFFTWTKEEFEKFLK